MVGSDSETKVESQKKESVATSSLRKKRSWSQTKLTRRMVAAGFEKFNQIMMSRTEK